MGSFVFPQATADAGIIFDIHFNLTVYLFGLVFFRLQQNQQQTQTSQKKKT